jgi:hypothetical protein
LKRWGDYKCENLVGGPEGLTCNLCRDRTNGCELVITQANCSEPFWSDMCPLKCGVCTDSEPAPDRSVNTRDYSDKLSCRLSILNGHGCTKFYNGDQGCDYACGLTNCSTSTKTTQQHCSGRGKCQATCTPQGCSGVFCKCDAGWGGKKCNVKGGDPPAKVAATTWPSYEDTYLSGYADEGRNWGMQEAETRCDKFGPDRCGGFTCEQNGRSCTLRSNTVHHDSDSAQLTFQKEGTIQRLEKVWHEYPGTFFHGYAYGNSNLYSLEGAKLKCLSYGPVCSGVTCLKDSVRKCGIAGCRDGKCTVRADKKPCHSTIDEISYSFGSEKFPTCSEIEKCVEGFSDPEVQLCNSNYKELPNKNPKECGKACEETPGCTEFSYHHSWPLQGCRIAKSSSGCSIRPSSHCTNCGRWSCDESGSTCASYKRT